MIFSAKLFGISPLGLDTLHPGTFTLFYSHAYTYVYLNIQMLKFSYTMALYKKILSKVLKLFDNAITHITVTYTGQSN